MLNIYCMKLTTICCQRKDIFSTSQPSSLVIASAATYKQVLLSQALKTSGLHITQSIFSPRAFLLKRSRTAADLERKPALPLVLQDGEGNSITPAGTAAGPAQLCPNTDLQVAHLGTAWLPESHQLCTEQRHLESQSKQQLDFTTR